MKPKPENLYKLSQERKALRSTIKTEFAMPGGDPESIRQELENIETRIKSWSISEEGGLSKAKERLRTERAETEGALWIDDAAVSSEFPQYQEAKVLLEGRRDLKDFEMRRRMDIKAHPQARNIYERILSSAHDSRRDTELKIDELNAENPPAIRAASLVEYALDLHKEGHIVITPSVQDDLDQIAERLINGKPMFLHGPTGTGKTSLARLASKRFTGKNAEMVYCNPQTRESSVWGKTGIRPAKGEAGAHGAIETVDIYGPLAKAMTEGKVIIFDEFTALPVEQQVFIKGIFNANPGDEVNVVGNGRTKIMPGFQMIFTANLKSEKNKERQELPPEIAREFEQNNLKVNYIPRHEALDVVFARLMQKDGSVTMSWRDVNETVPNFLDAMADIQTAYTGVLDINRARLTGNLDSSSKTPGLKKLVLTQGTVEAILEAWLNKPKEERPSFTEFLDQRLKTTLTFEEYPLSDRVLAAQLLAARGLLRTLTPKELNLPQDIFNFDAAKNLREDPEARRVLMEESKKEVRIPLSELVDLDPFNARKSKTQDVAANFGVETDKETTVSGFDEEKIKQQFGGFLKDSYKNSWSGSAEVVAKAGEKPEVKHPQNIDWENTAQIDASKFGEYTLNPETIKIDWESIPQEKIKFFPFSEFVGKKRWELAKYITTEWPDRNKYYIPGIEYWKYVFKNPDKSSAELKDGNWYYFFGSIFRDSDGNWSVPIVNRGGSLFERSGNWLGGQWNSSNRVVLLEK